MTMSTRRKVRLSDCALIVTASMTWSGLEIGLGIRARGTVLLGVRVRA